MLEGWLVDAGRFTGPSQTNASVADQGYGPPFGNLAFDVLVSAAPYALSTGLLQEDTEGNWSLDFHVPNYNFSPYDVVVITAESDGNSGDGWDPRPGAPFFTAGMSEMNAELTAVEMEVFGMVGPAMMADMREPIEVTLGTTPLAANAGLEAMTGSATLYSDGSSSITISASTSTAAPALKAASCWRAGSWMPASSVALASPRATQMTVTRRSACLGFGDIEMVGLDAAVEAAPYALSTGVAADNGDGTLSASIHYPGYNFNPYDAFVVTLESDCNDTGFDPRPGTPVLIGTHRRLNAKPHHLKCYGKIYRPTLKMPLRVGHTFPVMARLPQALQ